MDILEPLSFSQIHHVDHPGAKDLAYIQRREYIASQATDFRKKHLPFPIVKYTREDHHTWQKVSAELQSLHTTHACKAYKKAIKKLPIPINHPPQMKDVSDYLHQTNNFRLYPIEGLVDARTFLRMFKRRIMLCTQFIRHHSKPEFTPEPDMIHELWGHAPMFTDESLVRVLEMIGHAAEILPDEYMNKLATIYWFTFEYGLVEEGDNVKAFGAGPLAGIHDMKRAMSTSADLRPFTIEEAMNSYTDYAQEQPYFFVIPSFEWLEKEIEHTITTWIEQIL